MLKKLWNSTAHLHARFGVKPEPATARPVFEEEVYELLQAMEGMDAVIRLMKNGSELSQQDHRQHLTEEAIDVIVTICGLLDAYNITPAELEDAGKRVIAKNAAKTNLTHHINAAGKIARRQWRHGRN